MKIDYAIISSDSNPMYLDFWPIVSKLWKQKFNIEPILIYIDEEKDKEISEEYGTVLRLTPLENIPLYIQTLWSRYWLPSLYPNKTCIISDIDMLPLSKEYFIDKIKEIPDDKYVHLNPCVESYGMIPSCYHVAKGFMFSKVLKLPDSLKDSLKVLHSDFDSPEEKLEGDYWFLDEEHASKTLLKYKQKHPTEVVFLERDFGQNGKRIDRMDFDDDTWDYSHRDLKLGRYYDCHSIRPYKEYKIHIDKISETVLEDNNSSFKDKFVHLMNIKDKNYFKFLKDLILWAPKDSKIFEYGENNKDISLLFETVNNIDKCDAVTIKFNESINIKELINFFIKKDFEKTILMYNLNKNKKDSAKYFCEKLKVDSDEELQWIFKGDYVIILPIYHEI